MLSSNECQVWTIQFSVDRPRLFLNMAVYRPGKTGTVRNCSGYSIEEACVKLYDAMKGLGTDEAGVIDVISSHTFEERQLIQKKYHALYGKDLRKELDGELSFSFAKLVDSLMIDPEEYVLDCIHKAISSKNKGGKLFKRLSSLFKEGLGASEYMLIGMLCIRSNEDLEQIKKAYKQKYGEELDHKIAVDGNNMPHDVCSFIIDMISGEREADDKEWDDLDLDQLSDDCDELSNCQSEDALHMILQERSFTYLRRLFVECLKNVTGKSIENFVDDLKGQISAELEAAYRAMIKLVVEGEAAYYAERVSEAIEGAGTDNDTLIKVVVHRSEIDLLEIMDIYEEKYKKEMVADVGGDTSGDFKELLMKILKRPEYVFLQLSEVEEEIEGEVGLVEEVQVEQEVGIIEKVESGTVENHAEVEWERKGSNGLEQQSEMGDRKLEVGEKKDIEPVQVEEMAEVACNEGKVDRDEDHKETVTDEVIEEDAVVGKIEEMEEVNGNEIAEEEQGNGMEKCEAVAEEIQEMHEEEKDEEVDAKIVEENEQDVHEKEHDQDNKGSTLEGEQEVKNDEENGMGTRKSDEMNNLEEYNDPVTNVEIVEVDSKNEEIVEAGRKNEENGDVHQKINSSLEGSELPEEF